MSRPRAAHLGAGALGVDRRRFLQAAGLTTGGLFLPSLFSSRAHAQSAPPRRLVIFFSELGFTRSEFEMRIPGLPVSGTEDWSFDLTGMAEGEFSKVLAPLHRHRQSLIALENLSAPIAMLDHHGDAHAQGFCAQLTGNKARSTDGFTSHATTPSLDQIVARALREQDPLLTDLTSLTFAPSTGGSAPGQFGHWPFYTVAPDGSAQKVPAEDQPQQAFNRLFPNANGTPTPVGAAQSSVLERLAARYTRVADRLSVEDRQKLSAHRDMIVDFERRLTMAAQCPAPNIGTAPPIQNWSQDWPALYQWRVDAFMQLMAMSMSCGLTRVSTFNFTVQPPEIFGRTGDVHHDFSHPSAVDWTSDGVHDPVVAVEYMSDKMRWELERVASFVDTLKALPEGNGSVFDNTIVYYLNEISHGGHGHTGYTATILDGTGTFATGRYVYSGNRWPMPMAQWSEEVPIGAPNNRVLVALARAVGVDIDAVGATSYPGFIGSTQYEVSLRDPLDLLFG